MHQCTSQSYSIDDVPMSIMTKRVAAAAQGPSMQREAKISWGLRISPVELEREYLQNDLRFWQGADTVGLCFWIICNAVQFRVFNKVELSSCNWLFHWHTLPLMLLAALELVALARAQQWYRRHRLSVMIALRLSRTASQLLAYWILQPSDLFKLSGGKETAGVAGFAAALLVLTPLTQMQQALSCLLPFLVMLPVQLAAAALYFTIYLPKQLCTLQLIPALPELAHSWCDALAAAMDQCMLLLAMLPGASGMASGCGSSRVEALLLILLFFVLLLVLFIPVAFAFMRELDHKLQYLREQQQCKVVCAWDAWGLIEGAPPRLFVAAVVLLVPWQLALAGAALAMRVLPLGDCA